MVIVQVDTDIQERRLTNDDVHEGLKQLKECLESEEYKIFSLTTMSILMVVIVFGNGLIITSYFKFPGLRGIMYTLIVHLAVSDIVLGFGISLYPLAEIFRELGENNYFCATRFAIVLLSFITSTTLHVFLSLDRYLAIKYPFKHRVYSKNKPLVWTVLSCIWLVTLGLSVTGFVSSVQFYEQQLDMTDHFVCSGWMIMGDTQTMLVCAVFMFVAIFDFALYCVILYLVRQSRISSGNEKPYNTGKLKIVITIYVLMILCWGPFIGANIALLVHSREYQMWCVRACLVLLCMANYGINWIVYGLRSKKFNHAFKKLLRIYKQSDSSNKQPSSG